MGYATGSKDYQVDFVGGPILHPPTNPRWPTAAISKISKNRDISATIAPILTIFASINETKKANISVKT